MKAVLCGAVLLAVLHCPSAGRAQEQVAYLATGNPNGLYYPYGRALVALWSRHMPDVEFRAEITGASVANILQVAQGSSLMALAQVDAMEEALKGSGRFLHPMPVTTLFPAFPSIVHLIVPADSDIRTLSDLAGKRVAIGAPGSGNAFTVDNVMSVIGLTRNDYAPLSLNFGETMAALRDHSIDAGFIVAGAGVPAVTELSRQIPIRLIGFSESELERLSASFSVYRPYTLKPGMYRGVSQPVRTPTLWSYLVVREDMDPELARRILATTYGHLAELRRMTTIARDTHEGELRHVRKELLHQAAKDWIADHAAR